MIWVYLTTFSYIMMAVHTLITVGGVVVAVQCVRQLQGLKSNT